MNRVFVVLVPVMLAAAACSSDAAGTAATPAAAVSTTATTAAGVITPLAVCVDDARTWFGYTSTASTTVAIVRGPANLVGDGDPDDDPRPPTLFVPGGEAVAFSAFVDDLDHLPTWTLTGPDGVARVATSTVATPTCIETQLGGTTGDARTPAFDVTFAAGADSVEFTATLSGADGPSPCPAGLDSRPAEVWVLIDDATTVGTTVTVTRPWSTISQPAPGSTVRRRAAIDVSGVVLDQCTSGDQVETRWPLPPTFFMLSQPMLYCLNDRVDGSAPVFASGGDCIDLPLTDGYKMRSIPAT